MISFEIPEEIRQQLEMARMVAEQLMRPNARYYDEHEHEIPWDFVNTMWPIVQQDWARIVRRAERQLAGEPPPEKKREGPRYDNLRMIFLVEMLTWGDAGLYLCMPGPGLAGYSINAVGTPEQKVRFLKRFAEGGPKWGAMAVTEPGAGSDVSAIQTTAQREDGHWVLNGEKIYITNGYLALEASDGIVVVWATIDKTAGRAGIKPFVVEAGTPGVSITKREHKLGIRASDTAAIHFDGARIPLDNILGSPEILDTTRAEGFKGVMVTFDASRPVVAAGALGIARAAIEFTKEVLEKEGVRIRYGLPRHELTAVERDVIDMEIMHKAAWLLTLRAGWMLDQGQPNALEASMAKVKAGKAVTWITYKAVELLGPLGYSTRYLVEKWMRDAKINDLYEGTGQINTLIVARRVLGLTSRELK